MVEHFIKLPFFHTKYYKYQKILVPSPCTITSQCPTPHTRYDNTFTRCGCSFGSFVQLQDFMRNVTHRKISKQNTAKLFRTTLSRFVSFQYKHQYYYSGSHTPYGCSLNFNVVPRTVVPLIAFHDRQACLFVWCLTVRQHRIGQFVPTAGG